MANSDLGQFGPWSIRTSTTGQFGPRKNEVRIGQCFLKIAKVRIILRSELTKVRIEVRSELTKIFKAISIIMNNYHHIYTIVFTKEHELEVTFGQRNAGWLLGEALERTTMSKAGIIDLFIGGPRKANIYPSSCCFLTSTVKHV